MIIKAYLCRKYNSKNPYHSILILILIINYCYSIMEELIQKIEAIMNDELLFRNPELTSRDVARELATNRLYVSRAINTTFGYSFTVYLNRKRIEYSIAVMAEHPMMTMENVATESGFVSETAFFRKFKQIMNDSPRSYMKKIKP